MIHQSDSRVMTLEEACSWRKGLAKEGKRLVFSNGVFDLLHAGHVEYLEDARSRGDALLLGLNSDASVKRLNKGPERPLNCQEDRALILSSLRAVDAVVVFEEDTPLRLILALKPEVLAKGADYQVEEIVGAREVMAAGGRVERIPLRPGRSTSSLVERIRRS